MFERFSDNARNVVVHAQEEARGLSHGYIGTEHLLLGLLRSERSGAARALNGLGITLDRAREQVERVVGRGEDDTSGQIPFTARGKKVLELALREGLHHGTNVIEPEHILLGLVAEADGVATRVLADLGLDAEAIRAAVTAVMPARGARAEPLPRGLASIPITDIRVNLSPAVRKLLMTAAARALDEARSDMEPRDLMLALARDPETAAVLAQLGIGEDALREAIERSGRRAPPPGAEPEND